MGIIAAVAQNREIGCQNKLICPIKEDLEFFKKVTMDSYIIMGRSTYESIPKNLERRKYIVLSRDKTFNLETPKIIHKSLEETLAFVSQEKESKFWVIGGEIVYSNFLPYVNVMHITEIFKTYPSADKFFPEFNKKQWDENVGEKLYCPENDVKYRHVLYLRRKRN
ncbi:MAG TPA: dihydrofolate reductase [Bacilli bacterium]|nr:dihydrofolate reductase [Bacilli bacterium]